jgi:hypothetical protein
MGKNVHLQSTTEPVKKNDQYCSKLIHPDQMSWDQLVLLVFLWLLCQS